LLAGGLLGLADAVEQCGQVIGSEFPVERPGGVVVAVHEGQQGTLWVPNTGLPWEFLPQELGYGSGMTCWRRLRDWHEAGVWQRLHEVLLARLNAAGMIDWSRAAVDGSHVRALKGGPKPGPAPSTGPGPVPSIT
jgi:transposase